MAQFMCTLSISGGPAVQGEHICNPDPEGLPVCGREQGPGAECEGKSQGHGVASQGNLLWCNQLV